LKGLSNMDYKPLAKEILKILGRKVMLEVSHIVLRGYGSF